MHSSANSDFVFDYNCLPCSRSKRNSEAESYCGDCKSQMCKPCLEAHKRLYSGHKVFGQNQRSTWGLCKNEEEICGKHVQNILDRKKCTGCEVDDKIKRLQEQHTKEMSVLESRIKSLTDKKLLQQRQEIDEKLKPLTGSSYAGIWLCLGQVSVLKFVETYTELYDNQWTDAYEAVEQFVVDESTITQILLKAFEKTYTAAIRTVGSQRKMICESLGHLQVLLRPSQSVNIPTETIARQIQCSVMYDTVQAITDAVLKEITMERYGLEFKTYVKACAELCVQMAISPKPPHVEFHQSPNGMRFDTEIYKYYTKLGPKIEFFVWKPMYVKKDGPLLCKGVAQGMK
ncbi:uncharacterized protein LOC128222019 [Mya arenaria]|uniref:uncharacterized protein LOC128222019 n=1 Tax=Mya arenaria TaxID=6604 RepID=UPI0022E73B38|nr:uncharacterized protein LOC128222019 [Mya arenaria]